MPTKEEIQYPIRAILKQRARKNNIQLEYFKGEKLIYTDRGFQTHFPLLTHLAEYLPSGFSALEGLDVKGLGLTAFENVKVKRSRDKFGVAYIGFDKEGERISEEYAFVIYQGRRIFISRNLSRGFTIDIDDLRVQEAEREIQNKIIKDGYYQSPEARFTIQNQQHGPLPHVKKFLEILLK